MNIDEGNRYFLVGFISAHGRKVKILGKISNFIPCLVSNIFLHFNLNMRDLHEWKLVFWKVDKCGGFAVGCLGSHGLSEIKGRKGVQTQN